MSAPHRSGMSVEDYDRAAQAYLESLPPEHFMEATTQSTQREISVAGFALLRDLRPNVRYFGELLVQYFHKGNLRQVVPDNMIVLGELHDRRRTNYATELEPYPIFWALEYVSSSNKRKDYVDNFQKYEQELHIPYYLIFEPEDQDLRLYRHDGTAYRKVPANAAGRHLLPELELEIGLLGGWVRYWHRGQLLGIPVELQGRIRQLEKQLQEQGQQLLDRDRQLQDRDQRLQAVAAALRPLVEVRARQAGRQDILERLPGTMDDVLLTRWLTELA